jgi:phosphocarrier protein FPr
MVSSPPPQKDEMETVVRLPHGPGLHARPAARLVQAARAFDASVRLRDRTANGPWADVGSITQVLGAGLRGGHEALLAARGPEASAALDALARCLAREAEDGSPASSSHVARPGSDAWNEPAVYSGTPASPGSARGPLLHLASRDRPPPPTAAPPLEEWGRLAAALDRAREATREALRKLPSDPARQIVSLDLAYLDDPAILDGARRRVDQGQPADAAWTAAIDEAAEACARLESPYLRARAADLRSLGERVLTALDSRAAGPEAPPAERGLAVEEPEPHVVVARDVSPIAVSLMSPARILAICTVEGSPTSHSAILASTLGIPMVVGVDPRLLELADGTTIAVDGTRGEVRLASGAAAPATPPAAESAPGEGLLATRDGHRIRLLANVIGLADTRRAVALGAEGVGVLRTEFQFLERSNPPSEDEQAAFLVALADILGDRLLTVRTLDIGSDKRLPYLAAADEPNPALGVRGLRRSLTDPGIFATQLRAVLRASAGRRLALMFPMVSTLEEVRQARRHLAAAQDELRRRGVAFDVGLKVGIMVEVPAAALTAGSLAGEVDFFSLGTNDLVQYAMACDRSLGGPLGDVLQPAVLRLIERTASAARARGIPVTVCGEAAGDPLAIAVLLGLGVDGLSVSAPRIPAVRDQVARLTIASAQALARAALEQPSASAVRQLVEEHGS